MSDTCNQAISVHFLPAGVYMFSARSSTCGYKRTSSLDNSLEQPEASIGMHPIQVLHQLPDEAAPRRDRLTRRANRAGRASLASHTAQKHSSHLTDSRRMRTRPLSAHAALRRRPSSACIQPKFCGSRHGADAVPVMKRLRDYRLSPCTSGGIKCTTTCLLASVAAAYRLTLGYNAGTPPARAGQPGSILEAPSRVRSSQLVLDAFLTGLARP